MKVFKSLGEVDAAALSPQLRGVLYGVVKGIVDAYAEDGGRYDPDLVGYTVLLERGDGDADV